MANPQCENGYIRIATELYEALAKKNVYGRGSANGQVICAVIRKTYGYNKKEDAISISQLITMTGLCRRTVIYALQDLEAKNVLFIIRKMIQHGNEVNIIKLNKDYDSWVVQNSAPQIINNRRKAAERSAKLRKLVQNYAPSAKLTPDLVQNYENDVRSFAPTIDNITIDNIQKTIKTYCPTSDEVRLSELLLNKILERSPTYKKPNIQTWCKDIDKMIRIDKRDVSDIEKIIVWCQDDDFWKNNILSTSKLRKQYDQLALKMSNKPKTLEEKNKELIAKLEKEALERELSERLEKGEAT